MASRGLVRRAAHRLVSDLQGVSRVLDNTSTAREEMTLRRLEHGVPFTPGTATLGGHRIAYTHPHSLAAQYRDIFQQRSYDFDTANPSPRIIDCGANVGLGSLFWKSRYPASRITAFEPDPTLVDVLRRNLASAAIIDVEVVVAAVWTKVGELPFVHQGAGGGHIGEGDLVVPTVRLADLLDEPVDLLKVDIEGAEVDVFLDCAPALNAVERIFVEYHSFASQPQRLEELISVLGHAGYRVFVRTERCPDRPFIGASGDVMDMQLNIYARRS